MKASDLSEDEIACIVRALEVANGSTETRHGHLRFAAKRFLLMMAAYEKLKAKRIEE